ncbi:hypothetical protein ABT215_44860 [Streptomyces sp900105755]|uniref:hypothetical protein n=1 Tax=Streptomyces sp. 900105755 TaxID=3154389 RepID=UPI00331E5D0A
MPVAELLAAMNAEDWTVALPVRTALPRIAEAVDDPGQVLTLLADGPNASPSSRASRRTRLRRRPTP